MRKIHTYFGFKNGKLISVLQSTNGTYFVEDPQEPEKQIDKWKQEQTE
jgi:hypothetical protein